jgi:hypothetical protein
MQYVEVVEDIKAAFKAICSTEGFEGNRANAAKEYCSIHYGDTELSVLELVKGVAGGISDALYMLEYKYYEIDTEDKFVLDEETLDEEIALIKGIRSEDFSNIHQSVLDTINSVSDIVSLESPNTVEYEEGCDSLVNKLTEVKNNVYTVEEEILLYIAELTEQVDSVINLIESYSNKEKRVETYESSEEIVTKELQEAIEKYYVGNQTRALNAKIVAIGQEYHEYSVERLKCEAADKRLEEGFDKFYSGLMVTGVGIGCLIASGGTALPVLAGLGYLSGTGSMLYGTSNMIEGAEIEYYGVNGDITSASHNLFRDYVFDGDQELYDIVGGGFVKLSSLVMITSPFANTLSASNISNGVAAAKASVFSGGLVASEYASYGIEKYCEQKGYDSFTTMILQGAAYIGTLGAICKIGNYLVDNIASKMGNVKPVNPVVEVENVSSDALEGVSDSKVLTINETEEYAFNAIKGSDNADSVVLGKYEQGSNTSYDSVARDIDAQYFNLDNWNELSSKYSKEEIWKINERFLDIQTSSGREIYLSHNPFDELTLAKDSYYERELNYLIDNGYHFVEEGDLWHAIR